MNDRPPPSQRRVREFQDQRGGGGTRSLDYPDREDPARNRPALNRSVSGGRPNNPMAADIVGILHQQASGVPGSGRPPRVDEVTYSSQDSRSHPDTDRPSYRNPPGGDRGGRYGGGGPNSSGPNRYDTGFSRYGGAGGVVDKNVADLASLMELKARLALERAEQVTARQNTRRPRQEPDLFNTSNWPALK